VDLTRYDQADQVITVTQVTSSHAHALLAQTAPDTDIARTGHTSRRQRQDDTSLT
jgi:hypothetical protein